MTARRLSHLNEAGEARMVDVSEKAVTERRATAEGFVAMAPETLDLILSGDAAKGDVLAVAQVAAVMGAKKTSDLIPMCHPLMLTRIDVAFDLRDEDVHVEATVATRQWSASMGAVPSNASDATVVSSITGTPPPPFAITITSSATSLAITGVSTIEYGLGLGTTRRHPPWGSAFIVYPRSASRRCASSSS